MKIFLILLQTISSASAPAQPQPLNDNHMRDIGCVAILGLVAGQQKRGNVDAARYGDFREKASILAANVGQRVIAETGQSQEVVAIAMQQSAREQWTLLAPEQKEALSIRMNNCLPLLKDIQSGSEAITDVASANDYRVCGAIISILTDRQDNVIANKKLLFENLLWRYQQKKYSKKPNGQTFARADILKEKAVQRAMPSFDKVKVARCVTYGS